MSDPQPLDLQAAAAQLREKAPAVVARTPRPLGLQGMVGQVKRETAAASWAAVVPRRYVDARADDYEPSVRDALVRWGELWDGGVNLLITGPVGTGKTHAAFAAARLVHDQGGRFQRWPEYRLKAALDYRNPAEAAQIRSSVMGTQLLVLDDIGAHKPNDWWVGELFGIIEARWEDDGPTVVTTNLDLGQLEEAIGARTFSRLTASPAVAVRLSGDDRRRS